MKNKFILLTGASTGIGNATAQRMAQSGYTVFAGVRSEKDAAILRGYNLPTLQPLILDVTQKSDIENAFQFIDSQVGTHGLTAVINNAGINYIAPFELSEEAKVRQLMEVNLFGLIHVSQRFLPLLQRYGQQNSDGAKIVNIGSIGSTIGIPWEFSYHASKFAVLGLSESWRFELAKLNIKVTCLLPGGVRTPFFHKSNADTDPKQQARLMGENANYYSKNLEKMAKNAQQFERFASAPEKVALKIEQAIVSKNPSLKILVGMDAKIIYFLTKMGWTGLLKSQFVG